MKREIEAYFFLIQYNIVKSNHPPIPSHSRVSRRHQLLSPNLLPLFNSLSPSTAQKPMNFISHICGLGASVGCERVERTFNAPRLKSQICLILVCIPSSRQLKKYKIFVLPGWISGNIFMPPIVAFHEIPLVLRLQVLSVAGRLYSNLYIL